MRLSKSIVITISSILCISSIGLFAYASDNKDLKTDLRNAIQTIGSIKFIDKNNSSSFLSSGNNHLKITTNNLIITLTGENANTVNNTKGSSILGGKKNKIEGGSTGTIIGGYNNKLNGKSSTLLGGSGNNIKGDKSVIIGGENNNIEGNYSTILGLNNTLKGSNSSIIGTNNNVVGNLSFALGSGGTINTNNAFLWNDGESTITSEHSHTFSIISENGMVINTNKAADSAQLTISGSLNVFDSFKNENIQCGDDKGKGILKVMNKGNNNNQVCFCSCDGNNRSSILGKGQCEGVCKGGPLEPKCSNEIEIVKNSSNKYYLTGGCNNGKIVILNNNQSWHKDGKNTQYRACQTDDGTTTTCSGTVTQIRIITPDPDPIPEPEPEPEPTTTAKLIYSGKNCGIAPNYVTMTTETATYATGMESVSIGKIFKNWNTKPNGDGRTYNKGEIVKDAGTEPTEITLYAQCTQNQIFEDLELYFLNNNGGINHKTIMDRNLGATEVYNQNYNNPNKTSYGNYYQWGNNYAFPNEGSITTSSTKVNASVYGPGNYYNSSKFITTDNTDEDWFTIKNSNLWGGESVSIGDESDKQGPCPVGYHVPLNIERKSMYYLRIFANTVNTEKYKQWSSDLLLPFAGHREPWHSHVNNQGSFGSYWSSSYDNEEGNSLEFYSSNILSETFHGTAYGLSVRCFKNTTNPQTLTIHANGGIRAVIAIDGTKITALGTPIKEGNTFEGWYSDASFIHEVKKGDTAPSDLYAKWNNQGNVTDKPCNNCAKNGFPYCFPIDFSSSCNEDSYSN